MLSRTQRLACFVLVVEILLTLPQPDYLFTSIGIDKPDVRYVMHYSMPKSITHYYQESGRAGRDGQLADCILFYAYKDKRTLESMIVKSSGNPYSQSTRRKIDQLYTCLRYCEDDFQCRRTMQLEFFGEDFDRSKCGKTCDNCKAGREIEKRDLTDVARQILLLLSDVAAQRNGRGVTMTQLTELFRGSANKSITQYLQVNKLKGYGAGKKYGFKKNDLDRIAHAMVLDKILLESSEQNGGGFNSDYVRPGQFADEILNGRKHFFVQFPKPGSKPKSGKENNASSDKKKKAKKKAAPAKKSPAPKSRTVKANKGRLFIAGDSDDSDSDDDELFNDTSRAVGTKSSAPAVLPKKHTQALSKRIKKLLEMWAEEERMATGNRVFRKFLCLQQFCALTRVYACIGTCLLILVARLLFTEWNIMSGETMAAVAAQVPTTVEELHSISGLGENVIKEYGERLVKNINAFVQLEELQEYLDKRPPPKRPRTEAPTGKPKAKSSNRKPRAVPKEATIIDVDADVDEFDCDIDFNAIDIPNPSKGTKKSPYF